MANEQVSPVRALAERINRALELSRANQESEVGRTNRITALIEAAYSQTVAPGANTLEKVQCGLWNILGNVGFNLQHKHVAKVNKAAKQLFDYLQLAAPPAVSTPRIFTPFRGDGTGGELEAIEAALRFVDEHVSQRRCDAEAVSECVRCTAIYLAKIVKLLKESGAVFTPRCPTRQEINEWLWVNRFRLSFDTAQYGEQVGDLFEAFTRQFFQPDSRPAKEEM